MGTYEVRLRLWVDDALVNDETVTIDESWSDERAARECDPISLRHSTLAYEAEIRGQQWASEVCDLSTGARNRFGTTTVPVGA